MKVSVSPDLCCGAQLCAKVAPDFYRLEDGFNALVNEGEVEPPEDQRKAAVRGARACPESAIRVVDDDGTVLAPIGA